MRVIVTGGTGLIGGKLVDSLAEDGHEVIVLSRNPQRHTAPAGVTLEKWDAKTAAGWGHLADGADAIVNLAGESIAGEGFPPDRWTPEKKARILQSRLNAGNAVVEAIAQAEVKPKMLIQSSAVGYYGNRQDEVVDETADPGTGFLADVVIQWEDSTKEVENMGVRRVLLRTGVVYSMEGGALPSTLIPFKMFAGGPLGDGEQYVPWIHIEDEVRAIRFVIENESIDGPVNLSAPTPLKNKQLAKIIGKVMNRPAFVPAPAFALKIALGEAAAIVLDGQRAVPAKLQAAGFTYRYPDAESALMDLINIG